MSPSIWTSFVLFMALVGSASAAPTSIIAKANSVDVDIPAGKRLTLLNYGADSVYPAQTLGSWLCYVVPDPNNPGSEKEFNCSELAVSITGPVKLRIKPGKDTVGNNVSVYVSYDIVDYTGGMSPMGTAVIPSDNQGEFAVVMEASTDLKVWAPALPGNYAASPVSRFFRVRILRQN